MQPHAYEYIKPMPKAKADEFNKYYWIGRWYDATRDRSVIGNKLAAATSTRDPIMIGKYTDEYDQLNVLVDEAYKNARHFGALI